MDGIDKAKLIAAREIYATAPKFNVESGRMFAMVAAMSGLKEIAHKAATILEIETRFNEFQELAVPTIDAYLSNPDDPARQEEIQILGMSAMILEILTVEHEKMHQELDEMIKAAGIPDLVKDESIGREGNVIPFNGNKTVH